MMFKMDSARKSKKPLPSPKVKILRLKAQKKPKALKPRFGAL